MIGQKVTFSELRGRLATPPGSPPPVAPKVVWSSLEPGEAAGYQAAAIVIKHVARGQAVQHAIGGRRYRVGPGQYICIPPHMISEAEIRSGGSTTEGFCLLIPIPPGAVEAAAALEAPVVLPTACSTIGRLLDGHARELLRPSADRAAIATALYREVEQAVPALLAEIHSHLSALDLAKSSTRYHSLAKLNLARTYLHEVTDQPVDLATLARFAGMSRFQLLRQFRDCFGETPASYHRRLRLTLAKAEIEKNQLQCVEAAARYGFADGSSFSHAYRRTFGSAPLRSLSSRAG